VASRKDEYHRSLMSLFELNNIKHSKKLEFFEHYLISNSLNMKSSSFVYDSIQKLFKKSQSEYSVLNNQLVMSLGSIIKSIKTYEPTQDNNHIKKYLNYTEAKLKKCKEVECILVNLESYANSKLDASYEIFYNNIKNCKENKEACLISIKAIKDYGNSHNGSLKNNLLVLFYNDKNEYNYELRIEALNILLFNFKYETTEWRTLENIFLTMKHEAKLTKVSNKEFLYLSQELVLHRMATDLYFK
jgi:hypothetical protein